MLRKPAVVIALGIAALTLIAAAYVLVTHKKPVGEAVVEEPKIVYETLPGTIERADTPEKRTQGLSGRDMVGDNYGMLFIFPQSDRHGFWMKDMRVPIDIIWIAESGAIVHIERELSPETYPDIFSPPSPARYVLETKAGYAKEHEWEVGTLLDLSSYK